jgi:2-polyprenyl-3-methyl-5-hydroxy-6-metoxy-1,4-benzoquinol methylase
MTMTDKSQHWDSMYAMPVEQIPWEISEPPQELVGIIQAYPHQTGTALDIGCGTGNYSFYLAQNGYIVTGVDFAQKALDIAIQRNSQLKLPIKFIRADVTKLNTALTGKTFDLILDYSILHHIAPSDVESYAQQFTKLLSPTGKLLLVCYSDQDEYAHGAATATGKYGNDMFYRSRQEIEKLYHELTKVSYEPARLGKRAQHFAHSFIFEQAKS